jgi:hypothetical protein
MKSPAAPALADVIVHVLAPYLGPNMARAIARGQCEKLGLQSDFLSDGQATSLTNELRPGLNVFVGKDQTEQILAELYAALGGKAAKSK